MLFAILAFSILTFHKGSPLKCYHYVEQHANFWIDTKTLPSFPTNYSVVEAKHQCAATIRWFTLPDGKESFVDYRNDVITPMLPENSSLSFVYVGIYRDLRSASTRALVYGCAIDYCNNRTNLLKTLTSLSLTENFALLDVLFKNDTTNFTDQSSCVEFSNSTHLKCPSSATPLSSCSNCLLLEKESPQELCARCPNEPYERNDYALREVVFLFKNRTRLADEITLACRTKGCNALANVNRIHRLSKIEFDFKNFFA
jgi:hypothetical protein